MLVVGCVLSLRAAASIDDWIDGLLARVGESARHPHPPRSLTPSNPPINANTQTTPKHQQPQLVKDGFVIKKPQVVHSRARFLERLEAKRKGRHTGACVR